MSFPGPNKKFNCPTDRTATTVGQNAVRAAVVIGMVLAFSACGFWRPSVIPMEQHFDSPPCAASDGNALPLLVLLPGRFMSPDEFSDQGFIRAIRQRGLAVDVLSVDAHIGYYSDRSILDRLRADIFEPARQRGVSQIWIAGISIGGFGGMLYADTYPGEATGLIVLGPYLGSTNLIDAIGAEGGLRQWRAPDVLPSLFAESSDANAELHLWRWAQRQARSPQSENSALYLGYGRDDRYAKAHRLLADALLPERVVAVDGDHDWNTWRPAWGELLDRLPLERRADCVAE